MCGDTHGGVRLHGRVGDDLLLLALDQHVQKRGAAPVRRLKDGAFKKLMLLVSSAAKDNLFCTAQNFVCVAYK